MLVDEATQATQPSTLIALTRGAESVVMAGDDMQLPPTVISSKAQQLGLDLPLFTRMRLMGIVPELLSEQYRWVLISTDVPSCARTLARSVSLTRGTRLARPPGCIRVSLSFHRGRFTGGGCKTA